MALETVKLIGRALLLRSGHVFIGIRRPVTIAGTAQDTARAALFQPLGVKPALDSFQAEIFFAFVFHGNGLQARILDSAEKP
jgi:hypothetical protein